ncbi:hypothetical protein C8R46DRAFT_1217079 [Mycena filopes]|nr:hypothetical protein C8R46DRAFT_1217079 [Mycena filopes]
MRDPHETIVRNVLIFPADGSEPHIIPMTFSEAGAKANPYGFYTVNVDLRGLYGKRNMHAVRVFGPIPDEQAKITNGEYSLFHNISPKLPINASMARIVGVDPRKPGKRPMWRGDVVVIKSAEWPGPLIIGGGSHMDYLDVPPEALKFFTSVCIPRWYNSNGWRDFLQEEEDLNKMLLEVDEAWPDYQKAFPILGSISSSYPRKEYEKTARMIERLEAKGKKSEQDKILDAIRNCAHCKVAESVIDRALKVCGGCRMEKYCSAECQKVAWTEHKADCKARAATQKEAGKK